MSNWTVKVYQGVEYRIQDIPAEHVEIASYRPSYSITPYDYYGGKWQTRQIEFFRENGIEAIPLQTKEKRTSPSGSGPNGMVRFGDDMMPGVYRIAVHARDENAARELFSVKG